MTALLLSVVLATYLVLCFRYFEQFGISNLQAIVFNYWACVVTGVVMAPEPAGQHLSTPPAWLWIAITLGLSFFIIFNLMGYVARHYSATLTSLASKLSLIIPVTASVVLLGERFNLLTVISLVLALLSVVLFSMGGAGQRQTSATALLLSLLIFFGSGLNDTLVNYAVQRHLTAAEIHAFNIGVFFFAASSGTVALVADALRRRQWPALRAVAAGVFLGVPNYFSLYYLAHALRWEALPSGSLIVINNVGIVMLTAAAAALLFGERFGMRRLFALLVALVAMGLLYAAGQWY